MSDPDPDLKPTSRPQPIVNAPPAVLVLVLGLLAAHTARLLQPDPDAWVQMGAFVAALWPEQYWRVLSYAALHGDWPHVIMNSLGVLAFGTPLARLMGGARLWLLFALCVAGAAWGMALLHPDDGHAMVGASGGAAGLMGAVSRLLAGGGVRLAPLSHRTVVGMALAWVIINMVIMATGTLMFGVAVAWEAHLIGYGVGLLAVPVLARRIY